GGVGVVGEQADDIGAAGGEKLQIFEVDAERKAGGGVGGIEARDTAVDQQAAERHHERLHPLPGDQQSVGHAHQDAHREDDERGNRPRNAAAGDQVDEDHAEKRDHGTDRQLDAAGDDDEGFADGEHAEQADQIGRIGDVHGR